MRSIRNVLVPGLLLVLPVIVAAQGIDTTKVDQALGRSGQKTGDVYKVGFPGLPSWGQTIRQWSWATWFCWRTN